MVININLKEYKNPYLLLKTFGETIDELLDNALVYSTYKDDYKIYSKCSIGNSDYCQEFESMIRYEYAKKKGRHLWAV